MTADRLIPKTAGPRPVISTGAMIATVIAVAITANLAFYGLSMLYFDGHTILQNGVAVPTFDSDAQTQIRITFAIFSAVIAAATLAAYFAPRVIGHVLPIVLGCGSLVAGMVAVMRGLPGALIAAELVIGVMMPLCAFRSLIRRSRGAWAFLISMTIVYAVVLFFGSPTVHKVLGVNLWIALILPGLNIVSFAALVSQRANYREV